MRQSDTGTCLAGGYKLSRRKLTFTFLGILLSGLFRPTTAAMAQNESEDRLIKLKRSRDRLVSYRNALNHAIDQETNWASEKEVLVNTQIDEINSKIVTLESGS